MNHRSGWMQAALLAVVCAACGTDEVAGDLPAAEEARVAVQFSCQINVETRAAGSQWGAGDRIGIYMTEAGLPLADGNISEQVENIAYVTTGDGTFTPAEGERTIYFPILGNVDFYAYYPQTAAVDDYQLSVNVADQSRQEAIDLVYATVMNRDKSQPEVQFNFRHQLSNLVLDVQPGNGLTAEELSNLTITVKNQNTTATYRLADGALASAATPADVELKAVTSGSRYEAILLPTADEGRELVFDLHNGHDAPFLWQMPGPLVAGMQYHYSSVKISRTAAQVEGVIQSWGEATDPNDYIAQ